MLHSFIWWGCTKWCHFMQGMMRLFARNVVFYEKYCCARPILETFALTTNFKVHAQTCLLIIFSSLGCLVFLPMVLSNFLRGCSNYEKISKKWPPGWCPAKFKSVQNFAESIAATLKGRGYALQQNIGKTRKSKNQKLFRECFGLKFIFCCFGLPQVLWLENLRSEKSSDLKISILTL